LQATFEIGKCRIGNANGKSSGFQV
jgi:hypothetical protein